MDQQFSAKSTFEEHFTRYQFGLKTEKAAVITTFGLYEYVSIPFGLKNAGATFQHILDSIFKNLPFVYTYLDDIIVFS